MNVYADSKPEGERGAVIDTKLVARKVAIPAHAAALEAIATRLRSTFDLAPLPAIVAELRNLAASVEDLLETPEPEAEAPEAEAPTVPPPAPAASPRASASRRRESPAS